MKIEKGRRRKPFNVLLMGMPGIGKSTWASHAPKPIFCGGEEHDDTDADNLPQTTRLKDVYDQLKWLQTEQHEYKTLVIDTLDSIEQLVHKKILASDSKQTGAMAKAHGGYGAGYDMAEKEMIKFRDECKKLRDEKDMNLIFLCHTKTKKTTDPIVGADYDEFKLWLHEKAEAVFVDWVSAVLFATYVTTKSAEGGKTFAFGDGERIILTEKRPGHLAKNRYELPFELPMPVENPILPFLDAIEQFYSGKQRPVEQVKKACLDLLNSISDQKLKEKAIETFEKCETADDFQRLEARIKVRLQQ